MLYGKFDVEDLDLSTTALSLGYNIVGLNSNKVQHLSGRTISSLHIDRMAVTQRNRELYLDKWKDKLATLS
jgi:hypothetical protein